MRVIKLGIISLIVFAIFLTLLSFLFPSRIRISKAIDIQATESKLYDQLRSYHTWYTTADSNVLFGKNGIVAQLFTDDITTESTMEYVVKNGTFPDHKVRRAGWDFHQSSAPGKLSVQCYMDFKLKWYPWEKFTGLLLEKRYGPMIEQALEKLKTSTEK